MSSVKYVGEIAELKGRKFELPEGMPLSKATSYCEQVWFAEQLEREMEAEASIEAIAAAPTADVEAVGDEVEPASVDITPAPADPPPSIGAADAIAISRELMAQRDAAREQADRNAKILAEIKAAQEQIEAEKQSVLQCAKSNQQVMNEAFGSYGKELNEARVELARLRQEIRSLKGEG